MKSILMPLALLAVSCGTAEGLKSSTATTQAVISNSGADNCEFFVDGFAETYQYNQGWSRKSMHAEVIIRDSDIERVGMWIRYRDVETDKIQTTEVYGNAGFTPLTRANMRWIIEFAISGSDMPFSIGMPIDRFDYEVLAFALFGERSAGSESDTRRVWMSNGGRNFSLVETMAEPTYPSSLGRGNITWSNQNSPLFFQKRACN